MMVKQPEERDVDIFQCCLDFVQSFEDAYTSGKNLPAINFSDVGLSADLPLDEADHHDIVICSPHPDDEAICGALPLKLNNKKHRILNIALTLGSDPARQDERKAELAASCRVLGFDCRLIEEPTGFMGVDPEGERNDKKQWHRQLQTLIGHFNHEKPRLIIFPHAGDIHPAHVGTHLLALAAARQYSRINKCSVLIAETGFWGLMQDPNLLIALETKEIARMIMALLCHQGEVARNPYHLTVPARLMENVRRGAEITSFGNSAPSFIFAEMYKITRLESGNIQKRKRGMTAIIPLDYDLTLTNLETL